MYALLCIPFDFVFLLVLWSKVFSCVHSAIAPLYGYIENIGGFLELVVIVCKPVFLSDNIYNVAVGKTARPASKMYFVLCGYACPLIAASAPTYRTNKALFASVWL